MTTDLSPADVTELLTAIRALRADLNRREWKGSLFRDAHADWNEKLDRLDAALKRIEEGKTDA